MKTFYDTVIIGGGIVGASTAMQYKTKHPKKSVLLIEKEKYFAQHQTGHNSGVIHAGVYYAPGSLKADFCKRGSIATKDFCREHGIPYEQCGKIIVATDENELQGLETLYNNCLANELDVEPLDQQQMLKLEPNVTGIKGLLVKDSAITDYPAITEKMISIFVKLGGNVQVNSPVISIDEMNDKIVIGTENNGIIEAGYLIACAGLQADRIARMIGANIDFRIIPFRGEYFILPKTKSNIVKHLIYPVPDPKMPFLGVHLTNMIDGRVTVGPNAVLGFKREGYEKYNFNTRDTFSMVKFKGFWNVIKSNLGSGISEMKNSLWKPGYLKLVQRYCPSIEISDLDLHPPGVRAQAVMRNGDLVQDFLFVRTDKSLHVCNAPSPAATSAIPIGEYICNNATNHQ